MIGALDVLDSRYSSLSSERNWSVGVVWRKIENLAVAIVGNAKMEIGAGIGINLPSIAATIHLG